ncbi:MAG: hypothetical protein JSU63_01150 [Phycisphaerales bacterium]|nr:MAG: hypothetical protein JSU63_01150 [Phycisphaerales bacterium]
MILAQVTTHANSLYHDWTLIAAAWGMCVPLLAGVWWLLKLKSEETSASALKIRSMLAGLMERTFHIEVLKVFELIDEHLPYTLSQADVENARPSAFDRLCLGLRKLDPDEPDRDEYRSLLEHALSGIISAEAKKLLGGATPTRLLFSFRRETERTLAYIAEQTTRSISKERAYTRATSWTTALFISAPIAVFLGSPWVMFDTSWAFYFGIVCLSGFLVGVVGGLASLLVVAACQNWITRRAKWELEDWLDDSPIAD